MPGAARDDGFLDEFLREHRELGLAMSSISDEFKSADRAKARIDTCITKFVEQLEEHFRHEEAGGYLLEATDRAPRLHTRASRLCEQHTQLMEAASGLQMLARSGVESPAWWQQLESDFEQLRKQLVEHERQENSLVQEAFSVDIGQGD